MRTYSSFLIRYWRLSLDRVRIEVEHVQSGHRSSPSSLAEAVQWMEEVTTTSQAKESSGAHVETEHRDSADR
ncbi:MAG: hypothetical protein ACR2PL_05300 [Dehalococcoidia bacterium]